MGKRYCCFSEAIRDGAKMTPHGSAYIFINERGGTCALGAGAFALGLDLKMDRYTALKAIFPYLNEASICPACELKETIDLIAACLFDRHGWTREAIADWLYAEEEKLGFVTLCTEGEIGGECLPLSEVAQDAYAVKV
ncbi:MAG: hypothetical protein AABN95_08030 [Acidobacteriota bacterium]